MSNHRSRAVSLHDDRLRTEPDQSLDEIRALLLALREADLQLVRYIDRRKRGMPLDLAAFATALRDSRLQAVREVERRYHLCPYERA